MWVLGVTLGFAYVLFSDYLAMLDCLCRDNILICCVSIVVWNGIILIVKKIFF